MMTMSTSSETSTSYPCKHYFHCVILFTELALGIVTLHRAWWGKCRGAKPPLMRGFSGDSNPLHEAHCSYPISFFCAPKDGLVDPMIGIVLRMVGGPTNGTANVFGHNGISHGILLIWSRELRLCSNPRLMDWGRSIIRPLSNVLPLTKESGQYV